MAINDQELFELYSEVYEKTGWKGWELVTLRDDGAMFIDESDKSLIVEKGFTVLYTSDYLLEKLPKSYKTSLLMLYRSAQDSWWAGYPPLLESNSDTPLKALLKLILALKKVGEL